jgi:hypothetical protein
MTRAEFIELRDNPLADTMELYFFYFNLKTFSLLSFSAFVYAFSMWIHSVIGVRGLAQVQYKVLSELEQHFNKE